MNQDRYIELSEEEKNKKESIKESDYGICLMKTGQK